MTDHVRKGESDMSILNCVALTPEIADEFAPLIPTPVLEELREGRATGLGSLLGGMPNGALVFRLEADAARLLSLYVDEYDRRNGTGRFLMEKLRAILREESGIYSVRAALPEGDDGAAAFFTALGARVETKEVGVTHFPLAAMEDSPLLKVPRSESCVCGEKLGRERLSYYQRTLKKDGTELIEGSLCEPPVRLDLSQFYLSGQTIRSCVIMTQTQSGLCLAMMVNQGDKLALPALLSSLLRTLLETCPPETEISLEAVTPEIQRLVARLVPNAAKSSRQIAVLAI